MTYKIQKVKITNKNIFPYINNTISHFREIVNYLIPIIGNCYLDETFLKLKSKERNNYIESLIHKTKFNPEPKYKEFDEKFPQLPSYFRRTIIQKVIGIHSSFNTKFNEWLENKEECIKNNISYPRFNLYPEVFPLFYKGNMSKYNSKDLLNLLKDNKNIIQLKLLTNNGNYEYFNIDVKDKNQKKFIKNLKNYIVQNPTLEKDDKNFYLKFSYQKKPKYKLSDKDLSNITKGKFDKILKVLGFDLGIKNPITYDLSKVGIYKEDTKVKISTIHSTGFIRQNKIFKNNTAKFNRIVSELDEYKSERDTLYNLISFLNKSTLEISELSLSTKYKQQSCFYLYKRIKKLKKLIKKNSKRIRKLQTYFINYLVNELKKILVKNDIDLVIMENLDNFIKTKLNSLKQKFHHWPKGKLKDKIIFMLEDLGIRYRRVNPQNTSRTCNICKKYSKSNRTNQETFKCTNKKCSNFNIKFNADKNAAITITERGIDYLINFKPKAVKDIK